MKEAGSRVLALFRVVQGAEGVPAGEDQPDGVQVPDESLVRGKARALLLPESFRRAPPKSGWLRCKRCLQAFWVVSDGAGIKGRPRGVMSPMVMVSGRVVRVGRLLASVTPNSPRR